MDPHTTLQAFYREIDLAPPLLMPQHLGHFAVFDRIQLIKRLKGRSVMPYNKRIYYKVSWIQGHNEVTYADRVIPLTGDSLLFATPQVPYKWEAKEGPQGGHFCIFTDEFFRTHKGGMLLEQLPIFQPGQVPIFSLTSTQAQEVAHIFKKMHQEAASDYAYKNDLLCSYLVELIHYGQKLTPVPALPTTVDAADHTIALFLELLERQFSALSPKTPLNSKSPKDYANTLAIHVNYLNRILQQKTQQTTSDWIAARLIVEAKIKLRHSNASISEIAYMLLFKEVAHFSNFFKKHTQTTPSAFRTNS
ncbi:MAG: helix-turn-helix domain-containing protein [Aureispira sp.]